MNAVAQGITKSEFSVLVKIAKGGGTLTNRSVTQSGKESLISKGLVLDTGAGAELTGFGEKVYTSILLSKKAWLEIKEQELQAEIAGRHAEHQDYMERVRAQYGK